MTELDLSYNLIAFEENLKAAEKFQSLQVITIIGNPVEGHIKGLKNLEDKIENKENSLLLRKNHSLNESLNSSLGIAGYNKNHLL